MESSLASESTFGHFAVLPSAEIPLYTMAWDSMGEPSHSRARGGGAGVCAVTSQSLNLFSFLGHGRAGVWRGGTRTFRTRTSMSWL
jgi:hypothetical protein